MIHKKTTTNVDRNERIWYSFVNKARYTYKKHPHIVQISEKQSHLNRISKILNKNKMSYQDLVKNLETKVDKLSFIHQVSHSINSMQNIDELVNYALDQALNALESTAGSIFLWNDTTAQLELNVSKGRSVEELKGIRKRLGEGIAGFVAKDGKPVIVKNIHKDPRFQKQITHNHYNTNSFLCVPLMAKNKLVGVINITEKKNRDSFTEDELGFLYILSNHAAIAIDNMRLYGKIQTFNEELQDKVSLATKELQKAVQESLMLKNYKENIIESLKTGIYVVDKNKNITLWNQGMENQYKVKREYALGKHITELLTLFNSTVVDAEIQNVIDSGQPSFIEKIKLRVPHTNECKTINCNIFPLYDKETSNVTGVVVLHDDITEKIKLEKELHVSERLALIGKLASGIAHELNNPLDGTRRFINLSIDQINHDTTPNNNLAQEYLLSAKDGINRMIKIVHSLLEFSRQTTHLHGKHINLSEAIDESLKVIKIQQPLTHIKISKKLAPDLLPVIDYSLCTVITNIIDNAIDAMPDGGELSIETRKSNANDGAAAIIISDTGIGISEEDQTNIFDPFFTTKSGSEGSGLGLAICNEIIKRSNGYIKVNSSIGKGTTFSIGVPFKTT